MEFLRFSMNILGFHLRIYQYFLGKSKEVLTKAKAIYMASHPGGKQAGLELNGVFRFVLFCFSFCFVFGGPGGGFGGPGRGKATTETTKEKAITRTTKVTPRTTEKQNKTNNTV